MLFNAAPTTQGGGINTSTEQIVFLTDHYFVNEEPITYDSNLNPSISSPCDKIISGKNHDHDI